jgi:HSP20 family molecular chaperone IbpA
MFGWRGLRFADPWEDFGRISQELSRALGRAGALEPGARVFPPLNAYDDGESFVVLAEIPGVERARALDGKPLRDALLPHNAR